MQPPVCPLCIVSVYVADIDECRERQGGCNHQCVNTNGSYECVCPPGQKVGPDQKTCVGKSDSICLSSFDFFK